MILNQVGLGVQVNPSANLHVNGNAIITNQVFVGGRHGDSNLNINGTIRFGNQEVDSSTTRGEYSIILIDFSNDNNMLRLQEPSSVSSRIYQIKKTSPLIKVIFRDDGFIDNYTDIQLNTNSMGL